jgi:hypothetical protein
MWPESCAHRGTGRDPGAAGTNRGFEARAAFKSPRRSRLAVTVCSDDEAAIRRAQIATAYSGLLLSALGCLRLLYAARIGALVVAAQGNPSAGIEALMRERDEAIAQLIQTNAAGKRRMMHIVGVKKRQRRFRVTAAFTSGFVGNRRVIPVTRANRACGTRATATWKGRERPSI